MFLFFFFSFPSHPYFSMKQGFSYSSSRCVFFSSSVCGFPLSFVFFPVRAFAAKNVVYHGFFVFEFCFLVCYVFCPSGV